MLLLIVGPSAVTEVVPSEMTWQQNEDSSDYSLWEREDADTMNAGRKWNSRGWHHPGFPRKQVSDHGDPAVAALIRAGDKNAIAAHTRWPMRSSRRVSNACLRHADDVGMATTSTTPIALCLRPSIWAFKAAVPRCRRIR